LIEHIQNQIVSTHTFGISVVVGLRWNALKFNANGFLLNKKKIQSLRFISFNQDPTIIDILIT